MCPVYHARRCNEDHYVSGGAELWCGFGEFIRGGVVLRVKWFIEWGVCESGWMVYVWWWGKWGGIEFFGCVPRKEVL